MSHGVWSRNRLIRDAIYRAIEEKMAVDASIHCLGEGSVMKHHYDAPSILKKWPERIITLPISEGANVDFAVGLSLAGIVPVVDIITSDFLFRAMDAICNTVAKTNYAQGPRTIVIRAEFMAGGPTTGQRLEGLFTRIPGLAVVVPSNPADAYGLMLSALGRKGATLFFEDRMIDDEEFGEEGKRMRDDLRTPFGQAYLRGGGFRGREGHTYRGDGRMTVVSYGLSFHRLAVSLFYADVELIDLRTLYPLDIDCVCRSVARTRALLVVEPDVCFGGIGAELVAAVAERLPGVRVARIGAPRATLPASSGLHSYYQPSDEAILAKIAELTS